MADLPKVEPCGGGCNDPCLADWEQDKRGKCWGRIRPIEEINDGEGHSFIHACEAHRDVYEGGKYREYVAPLVLEPKVITAPHIKVSAHAQSVMHRGFVQRPSEPERSGHWTKTVPTIEGVYWWREEELDPDTDEPTGHWIREAIEVGPAGMTRRFGSTSYEKAHKWMGEWWSERIQEPPV